MRFKFAFAVIAICLTCVGPAKAASAERAVSPANRSEATAIVREMRRIVTANGVERLEPVRIGGINQWMSIRGVDRRNPILLMIHGGPGYVSMPTSWYFQRGWEDYFTVVQWDQRGAGKTYASNDPVQVAPTMTRERMIADAEEVITWLRKEFKKEKIFVLGHSWGSYVGLSIAQRHPEWLHAYVGAGQMVDALESERRGWQFALDRAERAGNKQAVKDLQSIAPYAQPGRPLMLKDLYLQRKWLGEYGGAVSRRTGFSAEVAAVALSPEYTDADLAQIWKGNDFSANALLIDVLNLSLSDVTAFKCPVFIFNGRDDYNVSSTVTAEWFARVEAPSKSLVWFEHSAHEMFNEEPGKMLVSLVQHLRPIAERAGDVAP